MTIFFKFHTSLFHTTERSHVESVAVKTSTLDNKLPVLKLFTSPKTYNDGHFY